jgi:hypothetical protein
MVPSFARMRLSFIAALLFFSPMGAAQSAPQTSLVEAEVNPLGAVITDSSASGGKYVTSEKAYQPLVSAPLLSGIEGPVTVWVQFFNRQRSDPSLH